MPEILLYCPLLIIGAGLFAPSIVKMSRRWAGYLLCIAPFTALGLILAQGHIISGGEHLVYQADWFSALGASLDMRLNGFAYLMSLLITGIGGFIIIYAQGYLQNHPQLGRFFLYLMCFMGAMLGLVLADNLILLFVFWELTSITSYLLIGFKHEDPQSRWKALQALLITGMGAMAMLAGFVLLAQATGTWKLSELNTMSAAVQASPLYTATVILVLVGAFTKSAQIPFHFWLPNAMAAPTPVSAYLHSATMVKAGVFLMATLNPILGNNPLWNWTLSLIGSFTLLLAVALGIFQTDLKRILAYTTLAVLGMLTMLIGLGSPIAIKAMVLFLFGHALYKAALFMVAGSIDHESGTRDVTQLQGLRQLMPITCAAAILAALSKCGFPPFLGFLGKEYVYKAGVALDGASHYFLIAAFVGNFLVMAMALSVAISPFFGKQPAQGQLPKHPHEAPLSMWIGPIVLGTIGFTVGLFPNLIANTIVGPAIAAVLGTPFEPIKLSLWHGINLPLILSVLTLAIGYGIYRCRRWFWRVGERALLHPTRFGAEAAYNKCFNAVIWFSKAQTRFIQTGRLHDYVSIIVAVTVALLFWAISSHGGWDVTINFYDFDIFIVGLVTLMIIAAVRAVTADSYVTVLVSLGVVGFGMALIFAYYGAPDLAITQLLVETLTVVLFMFVILRLPKLQILSGKASRIFDACIASAFGGLITMLVLKAVNIQFDHAISNELANMSYLDAKGKNVVNVILVDFRALDTLGEVVVVATAALGIAALVCSGILKKGRPDKSMDSESSAEEKSAHSGEAASDG